MIEEEIIQWSCRGTSVPIGITRRGEGPAALLLPALSSISTRHEMNGLQERLARSFRVTSVDWPGFGDRPRPRVDWTPEVMEAFLGFVLGEICPAPELLVAAGHGAGYVVRHLMTYPAPAGRIVLVSPTWRGPFPTMMKGERPWFARVRRLVDLPVVGPVVYKLNVNDFVIRHMAAGHVYADKGWLEGERFAEKRAVTTAKGARFGSARFVTGGLDPFGSREAYLEAARRCAVPLRLVYGAETPPKSKAEMAALGELQNVEAIELPKGKLSVYEEFPDLTAEAVLR